MSIPIAPRDPTWSTMVPYLDKVVVLFTSVGENLERYVQTELSITSNLVHVPVPSPSTDANSEEQRKRERETKRMWTCLNTCSEQLTEVFVRNPALRSKIGTHLHTPGPDQKCFPTLVTRILRFLNHSGVLRDDAVYKAYVSLMRLLANLSDVRSFAVCLGEAGCTHLAYENIVLSRHLGLSSPNPHPVERKYPDLVETSLAIMYNVVRRPGNAQFFLPQWRFALLELLKFATRDTIRQLTIFTLAHTTSNENAQDLVCNASDVVRVVLDCIHVAQTRPQTDEELFYSIEELLDILVVLTVQPQVKIDLIRLGGMDLLKGLCQPDQPQEMERAIRILCNLMLDEVIQKDETLLNKPEMRTFVQQLQTNNPTLPATVTKNLEGVMWLIGEPKKMEQGKKNISQRHRTLSAPLNEKEMKSRAALSSGEVTMASGGLLVSKPQVFISYAGENKTMVHKMWHKLEDVGIKCWVDEERMEGSSIEAMASGIQAAKVVVLCMSSAYHLSHWGKMEADYATKLRKPIIPAIVEYKYKPDGWEGFILGDKIYYEFSERRNFEDTFARFSSSIHKRLLECTKRQ